MKKALAILSLLFASAVAHAQTGLVNYFGDCSTGAGKAVTQGLPSSNYLRTNYPQCTVTVYAHGTSHTPADKETIYADSNSTPLGNPFTANANALYGFYMAPGQLIDIVMSSSAFVTMPTTTISGIVSGEIALAGVQSINNQDGAFTFTGPGVSCTGTNCVFTGTGATTLQNDLVAKGSASTFQDEYNFYADAGYTAQQAFSAASANNGSFTIQPTAGRQPFVATGNTRGVDLRGDVPATAIGVTEKGAVCDTSQVGGSVTTGSNVWTITFGALTTKDIGKTVAEVGNVGGVPTAFESVITAVPDSLHATLTSNSPFTAGNAETWYGHDDTVAITNTMNAVGQGTLVFPANGICFTHTQKLKGQSPIGLGPTSAIAGFPGEDIFQAPDPSLEQGLSQGAAHIHDLTFYLHEGIDATAPWDLVNDSGTTHKAAMYRPVAERTGLTSDPTAPGWMQGANSGGGWVGVGSAVNGSTAFTVAATSTNGGYPANGTKLVFPYQTNVFTTTVASGGGTANIVLANAFTGTTNTQAEFMMGTSPQSLSLSISSGACPVYISLNNNILPVGTYESNVAPYGLIQIDGEQMSYFGRTEARYFAGVYDPNTTYGAYVISSIGSQRYLSLVGGNRNNPPATSPTDWQPTTGNIMFITGCAQNGTSRAAHSANATVVPLNQFKPTYPWPVTPSINTNDTTPAGTASFYPGFNVGNAAFAFPLASGINQGTGANGSWSPNAKIENLSFFPIPGSAQEVNHGAMMYFAQPSYASSFENLFTLFLFYGVAEGGPSISTGNWAKQQPTADGSHWNGLQIWAANPWLKAVGNQNSFENFNMYSSENSLGADTCFFNTVIWNDQTGGVASGMSLDHYKNIYCEPEGGNHAGQMPNYEWDTDNSVIEDLHMGGGGEVYMGGAQQQFIGGNFNQGTGAPAYNWGFQNTSQGVTLLGSGVRSNVIGVGTLIDYGYESNFMGQTDNAFSNPTGPLGGLQVGGRQPFGNQTMETFQTGNLTAPYTAAAGGLILPDEFNTSHGFEANPFTVGPAFDDTAPISHHYIGCPVGTATQFYCFSDRFNENEIPIGADQRLVPGRYSVYAAFKDITSTSNAFQLIIGTATGCGQAEIINKNIPITNTWPTTQSAMYMGEIDYTGAAGCSLAEVIGQASTADTIQQAFLAFAPVQENIYADNINAKAINLLNNPGCLSSPVVGLGQGFLCPSVGWSDQITANQGATDTTISISGGVAGQLSNQGCFFFGQSEIECYTGKSGSTLTGIKRGQYTTVAVAHNSGDVVVGYTLILSPGNQPSFDIAYGLNEQQVVGINNIYPSDHGGASVFDVNQGNSELWINTSGGITQSATYTFNQFDSPVGIGELIRGHAVINDSGYLMQTTLLQTDYVALGLGGGVAGSLNVIQPPTITAPTLQPTLGGGAATVSYVCSGTDFDGNLVPGTAATLTGVQATWAFPTGVVVICPYAAGINTYQIYRTAGGPNQGLLASGQGPGFSYGDNYAAAIAGTPPATNTTIPQLRAYNLSTAFGTPLGTCLMTGSNGAIVPVNPPVACGSGGGGGGGMVYPAAGIGVSNGSAWTSSLGYGTSGANVLLQLTSAGFLPSVNAAALTSLTPANISPGVAGISIAGEEDVTFSATPTFSNTIRYSSMLLTGNVTGFTLAAGQPGQEKNLTFCQATPGGFTVVPPSNVLAFMAIVPTTSACTTQHYVYRSTSAAWLADGPGTTSSATAAPAPTIAAGTAAGTAPTVAVVSGATSESGFLSVVTGTTPAASATVATVTFGVPFPAAPRCQLWPANATTQALVGTAAAAVYPSGTSGTAFALSQGPTALTTATSYLWGYKCSAAGAGFTGGGSSGGGSGMVYPTGNGIAVVTGGSAWAATLAAPTGTIVGTTDTQTLTNKTLTNATITSPSLTASGNMAGNVWYLVQTPTNFTAQAANIPASTVTTATATEFVKICAMATVTRAATTSSALPTTQVVFTDANDSNAKIINIGASAANTANTVGTGSAGCVGPLYVLSGSVIQAQTSSYASVGATTMQYDITFSIETY